MKKNKNMVLTTYTILLVFSMVLYFALPLLLAQKIKVNKGSPHCVLSKPKMESVKKTVFMIVDNDGTERLDLLIPF